MKALAAGAVLLALAAAAPAQEFTSLDQWARRQLSREMADCTAFYVMCTEALMQRGDYRNARVSGMLAGFMLDRAVELDREAAVMAYTKVALARMLAATGHNLRAVEILVDAYGESCWETWKDQHTRLAFWMEHKDFGP